MSIRAKHKHTRVTIYVLFLLFLLILPGFITQVESSTSTNKLYAHMETTTIGGVSYYLNKLVSADAPGISLNASAVTAGRKLMGRWVYPLSGIVSIPVSTWTVTYRAMKSASAVSVVAHGDVDILIRKSDNTIRTTIATNVANSSSIPYTNTWETLTAAYSWPGYTVIDQTDYLEVAYYIEVVTPQNSKTVRLRVDDNTLALADQTKVENVIFGYPNQPPIASFTFSPSTPLVNQTVTFDASASHDPDGSIVSYKWDFGDGNVTTVTNPIIKHVYTTAGSTVNYKVTLTVTDNEGSTGFATQIVPVANPSILCLSLPAGTYVGPNPDNWLSQCWLLNITGLSGTYTVRTNNTHASYVSYDTHLIIALNNASYQYLNSLTVNTTTIPKTSFTYGTPTPYGYTLTWEGDVYPMWFSDTYIVGAVNPKSYEEVAVSVAFSNASGVRMHFDAYGSTDPVPPQPTSKGHVTENPHEKDSTVQFFPSAAPPLLVSISPTSATMDVGQSVSFTSAPTGGTPPYTYQWYLNGSAVSGATSSSWTFTPTLKGYYQVYLNVTDSLAVSAQSNTAQVTVNQTPTVSISPTSVVMDLTQSVTFTSTVSGGTPPYTAYQWYLNGAPVPGATSATWTFTATSAGPYQVYLNVTDSAVATAKSNVATVTVNPSLAVSITPTSATMDLGQSKTFTSVVSGGTPPYSYQWYLNNAAVPGATSAGWTFTPTSVGAYTVYLNVTDSATSPFTKKSNVASVTVNPALTVSISPSPSVTLDLGQSVTFTSVVSGGTPPYSYQWVLNNNPVSGATSASWAFTPTSAGAYTVYLNVTDSGDPTVKSNVVSVTVNPALSVTISPVSASIAPSQSVIFTSAVSGGTTPYTAYQWYLNGAPVPGATLPGWAFTPTSTGTYSVYLSVTDSEIPPVTAQSNIASVIVTSLVGGSVHSITNLDLFESWRSTLLSSIFLTILLLSFAAIKSRRKPRVSNRV